MKAEPRDIDTTELSRLLATEYGLQTATLSFLAKGEDSYGYISEVDGRKNYFVRVQPARGIPASENALRVAHCLRERCRLHEIVAALQTLDGSMTCAYRNYRIAAFPFVEGPTAWEVGISAPQLEVLAQTLARLHNCDARGLPELPVEHFHHPFRSTILGLLKSAPGGEGQAVNSSKLRTLALLRAEELRLFETLEHVEQLGRRLRLLSSSSVITHGDPNCDNWILSPNGLRLIDCGDLAFGPRERDLFAFTGEHFAPFLEAYISTQEKPLLTLDAFAFYFFRWALQEIADYGSRLLIDDLDPVEREYAWTELQKYLPIRRDSIAAELSKLQRDAIAILGLAKVR